MSKSVKKQNKTVRIQVDKAKKQSKTYFSCNKRMLQCHNQPHMLPSCSIAHCAKEWGKEEFFSEFLHF